MARTGTPQGRKGGNLPSARGILRSAGAPAVVSALALLLALVVAYRYTLTTLAETLALDTPLAYLGLVPLVALGLAVVVLRGDPQDHAIHDRQVDLLVGGALLAGALVVVLLLPDRLGTQYWLWRLDVLSLPLFAAALVALLLGTRLLWRLRVPILFLAVAWPLPWTALLERTDQPLLGSTAAAVTRVTEMVPVARPYGTGTAAGDPMFEVVGEGSSFVVTVASACAGASSTVGFLLLGSATMLVARGSRRRKLLWLLTGLGVAWVGNVARILVLLLAGKWGGKELALETLHPVLGTVVFAVTTLVMLLLLRPLGLSLPSPDRSRRRDPQRVGVAANRPITRVALAGALGFVTLLAGAANGSLAANERIVGPNGQARLAAFSTDPARLQGWEIGDAGEYPQAARYFGSGASWHRLLYHTTTALPGTSLTSLPVSVDVVGTRSLRALNAFGLEECYSFHRFEISAHDRVEVGAGVRAELFTYYNKRDRKHWNALAWQWPVRQGAATRYERVVLLLVDVAGIPVPSLDGVPRADTVTASTARRLALEREFLQDFARALVQRVLTADSGSAPDRSEGRVA